MDSSRRRDDYRELKSYRDDHRDYRDRDGYKTREDTNKSNVSDLEKEAKLKEMLLESKKLKNDRDESTQMSRENELRNKLLAARNSKTAGNETPEFL